VIPAGHPTSPSLPADTAVPWWDGRLLHFEFA
jgi:hypothetical protein